MTYGKARYAQNNALLNAKFDEHRVLIAAHRGSWVGNIIQNTVGAYRAALLMGADVVESDASMTADGVVYSFHDGAEHEVYDIRENIKTLDSQTIDGMHPLNALRQPCSRGINRLEEVLEARNDGTLINIDRSWFWFEPVLDILDRYPHAVRQCIIKAPLKARHVLEKLDAHPVKYMFMPICYTFDDIRAAMAYEDLNMVGAEIIAIHPQDELYGPEASRLLHENNMFSWVNTLVISDLYERASLYGGLDDDISILDDPQKGWGRLIDMGVDVLQTDWPAILRDFRARKLGE